MTNEINAAFVPQTGLKTRLKSEDSSLGNTRAVLPQSLINLAHKNSTLNKEGVIKRLAILASKYYFLSMASQLLFWQRHIVFSDRDIDNFPQ